MGVKRLWLLAGIIVLFSCVKKTYVNDAEKNPPSNGQPGTGKMIPADIMEPALLPDKDKEEYEYIPLDDADVYSVTVTSDGVKLRTKGATIGGFRSYVIKQLSAGDQVAVLERRPERERYSIDEGDEELPPNYWYKVLTEDGDSGYVYGGHLSGVDDRHFDAAKAELKKRTAELGPSFNEDFQSLGNMTIQDVEKAKKWPLELRCMVTALFLDCGDIKKLPDLLSVFPSLYYLNAWGPMLEDISVLRGCKVLERIFLMNSAISDAGVLSTCDKLEVIALSKTKITEIPDLSRLKYLKEIYIDGTPIKSLKGIETGASEYLNVSVKNCDLLEDLAPLIGSNISQIVFDEKNYKRLESWYEKNSEKIKANRDHSFFNFGLGFVE